MVAERVVHQIPEVTSSSSEGLRARRKQQPRYEPPDGDWDPTLPFGGKVFMARRKKPETLTRKALEAALVVGVLLFCLYAYFYFEQLHFLVTHFYAHLGHSHAQHQVGQRYLHGVGVEQDHGKAFAWFRAAADQQHPHASYNLAVGHLQGYETDVQPGEAHRLIRHAASQGVDEAHKVLKEVCSRGGCP